MRSARALLLRLGVRALVVSLAGDEGHGFGRKSNRDMNAAIMSLFLERFVLAGEPGEQQ
ncbi:MAG TPA: hypothetical protein VIS76_01765 [Pseudomonadales bacterium]